MEAGTCLGCVLIVAADFLDGGILRLKLGDEFPRSLVLRLGEVVGEVVLLVGPIAAQQADADPKRSFERYEKGASMCAFSCCLLG